MTSDKLLSPLRTLDTDKQKAIDYFYRPSGGTGLFLIVLIPVTLGLSLGGAFWRLGYGLLTGATITVLGIILRWRKRRKKMVQASFVYQYGREEQVVFTGLSENHAIEVNNMPQQVISLLRNGFPMQIKTFDPHVIEVYTLPQQVVYTHPEYEDVIVPSGLFLLPSPKRRNSPGRVIGMALIFILPLAIIFGGVYFIQSQMDEHSYSYGQPDALIYHQANRLVLASVVTHFQANEVSGGVVSGSDNCYAVGMDMQTGKQLWKVNFHAKDNNGRDIGGGRLLGQSTRYLFFLRNELYVIDKATGDVVARNENFPAITNKMSKTPVLTYEDDGNFAYNDSLQAVVVKGTDGLFYIIDGLTLKANTIDIPNPDEFFRNKFKYGNNYENQITSMSDDGSQCLSLLDATDTLLLASNSDAFRERPAQTSVRRKLYSCPSNSSSSGWSLLTDSVFLFGGFLADPTQPLHLPADTISKYVAYQHLLGRYDHTNPPMRNGNEGFLILHKASIEPNAKLLLSGISAGGKPLWQVNTGYATLPLLYQDKDKDELFLAGNVRGDNSDNLNEMTGINLKTGEVHKYDIK